MPSSLLLVVAAVIIDDQSRILLSQRPSGKNMAGYWEFPGGKVNRGETPEEALCRELHEELGIQVTPDALQPITFASQIYKRFHLLMPLYHCRTWSGDVTSRENQNLVWIPQDEFNEAIRQPYKILPTDLPLISQVLLYLKSFK